MSQMEIFVMEVPVNMEFASLINSKDQVAHMMLTVQLDYGVVLRHVSQLLLQEVLVLF